MSYENRRCLYMQLQENHFSSNLHWFRLISTDRGKSLFSSLPCLFIYNGLEILIVKSTRIYNQPYDLNSLYNMLIHPSTKFISISIISTILIWNFDKFSLGNWGDNGIVIFFLFESECMSVGVGAVWEQCLDILVLRRASLQAMWNTIIISFNARFVRKS